MRIAVRLAPGTQLSRWDEVLRRSQDFRPVNSEAIAAMRRGEGSVAAQLQAQATFTESGAVVPFPRTRPFGTRPQPLRTLLASGRYRMALDTGGEGAVEINEPLRVGLGLDPGRFPQWPVFQAYGPTVIRAKRGNRARNGRLMMQVVLGLLYGVWISEQKLLEGLVIQPRPVRTNPLMKRRVAEIYRAYLVAARSDSGRGGPPAPYRLPPGLRRAA